jgi:type II secretion system protein N
MNPFRNRPFLFLGLILYTLLVTASLLYFRFPAEKFKLFCQTELEQLLPGTSCTIAELSYKFPLRVEAGEIKVNDRLGKKEILCTIDQTTIRPKLKALKPHFHVTIEAGGGKHEFSLLLQQNAKKFSMEDIQLSNLDLASMPFIHKTFGRKITGSLSGNGTYNGTWTEGNYTADGKGSIRVEKGSFSLLFPILSLKKIDLKKFTTELVLQENRLHLNKASFQGKELKGDFSGDLALQSPIKRSKFSIKGALEPLPPLLKKSKYAQNMVIQLKRKHNRSTLPFLLQGSVERPKFKFDS